jgi:hypothetical protein
MTTGRGKRSKVVSISVKTRETVPSIPTPSARTENIATSKTSLYGVAMLKIALELKKSKTESVENLIRLVLGKMRIDETEFMTFLDANGGLLRTIARRGA